MTCVCLNRVNRLCQSNTQYFYMGIVPFQSQKYSPEGTIQFFCQNNQYKTVSGKVCHSTCAPKLINSDFFLEKRATVPIKTQGVQRSSSGKMSTF